MITSFSDHGWQHAIALRLSYGNVFNLYQYFHGHWLLPSIPCIYTSLALFAAACKPQFDPRDLYHIYIYIYIYIYMYTTVCERVCVCVCACVCACVFPWPAELVISTVISFYRWIPVCLSWETWRSGWSLRHFMTMDKYRHIKICLK